MGFISKGLKNEFETSVVNKPSVFEPLKLYCVCESMLLFFILYSELHIREGIEDNSKIIFLISQGKHIL